MNFLKLQAKLSKSLLENTWKVPSWLLFEVLNVIIIVVTPKGVWKCIILMIIYMHGTNIKPK